MITGVPSEVVWSSSVTCVPNTSSNTAEGVAAADVFVQAGAAAGAMQHRRQQQQQQQQKR